MLTDRKQELERRLSATMEENNLLQGTVEELQDRVLILERQRQEKDVQVRRLGDRVARGGRTGFGGILGGEGRRSRRERKAAAGFRGLVAF